ncbi:monocarboxylate transporter 10 [Spodoptera litura]|uniref:Monocarboxylate transporter 10 n=1 Tax=Spodoptera litura TaxID=69820 RepID=A0A9J7EG99_SPOLT|nr:monocarboxylate transporter 10 [Spodoptera litura]
MVLEPKENSDLLKARDKVETNGNLKNEDYKGPPDGGVRAYSVMVASFLTNGLFFGVINSYSVIYTVLEKHLKDEGISNSESRAALVGALTMGTTFFLSPLSGVLTGVLGIRLTAVLGGTIATAAMLLSSFFVYNVGVLYFTYGIMYGLGASFAYTPSLAILGHYFKKHLGLVNGVVTVGSSIFTVIMPPLMEYMIKHHGLDWLLRLLAVFTLGTAVCGFIFKPTPSMVMKTSREDDSLKSLLKSIVNIQIWKNKKYRFWALSMPVALFGYFVPYVHIKKFIENNFDDVNTNLPLQCIAVTSGLGRLIFGFLADKPGVDRILLQQISFYVIGVLTIILPFVNKFGILVAIALGMGIFDGAFIALIGPIAFELCGGAYAAQAIGCMLGLAAAPLSVGPPIAGYLYSMNKSYTLPFVLAGISPLVGATLMFAIRLQRVPSNEESINTNGITVRPVSVHIEKSPSLLLSNGDANQQTNL